MHELMMEATFENISAVQDFVGRHIEDCPQKVQHQMMIAVDEIFSNIVRYAYNPDVGCVVVRIAVGSDIVLEFEDSGVAYDPLSGDDPDITLSAEERDIGGLGIFMVKNIMDSVNYRRDGNKNILTVSKKL